MTVNKLIKELNRLKRKHGNLNVRFDISSVLGEDVDEVCVMPILINGVFKVRYENSNRSKKEILLIDGNSESYVFDPELNYDR